MRGKVWVVENTGIKQSVEELITKKFLLPGSRSASLAVF